MLRVYGMEEITKKPEAEQEKTPAVSVIMPVYNAMPYLTDCLDSVLAQTMRNFELICVDDGSTDESLNVLKSYAQKDDRVRILTQRNQYAGVARNNGMDAARGEYLLFLDADDLFAPEMLEKMLRRCTEDRADICICNIDVYDMSADSFRRSNTLDKKDYPARLPFAPQEYGKHLFTFSRSAVWNKLIHRTLPLKHGIRFEARRIANDVYFAYCCTALAERITYEDSVLLHLRRGQGTNLEASLARSPMNFAEALCSVKRTLLSECVYDDFENAFVSAAISHSFLSVNALKSRETRQILLTALREKYFPYYGVCDREKEVYESCLVYAMLQWLLSPLAEDPSVSTAKKAWFMAKACVHGYGLGTSVKEWYKYIRKTLA